MTLSIVLKLFEMILSEIRKLDCSHITEVQINFEKEWEVNSNKLKGKEDDKYELCDKLLDFSFETFRRPNQGHAIQRFYFVNVSLAVSTHKLS